MALKISGIIPILVSQIASAAKEQPRYRYYSYLGSDLGGAAVDE